jgi:hypothetical protein
MTVEEFESAIATLGWKGSDFCRAAGVGSNTVSRWRNHHVPIPLWVDKFLGMAIEVKRLHDKFLIPGKGPIESDA